MTIGVPTFFDAAATWPVHAVSCKHLCGAGMHREPSTAACRTSSQAEEVPNQQNVDNQQKHACAHSPLSAQIRCANQGQHRRRALCQQSIGTHIITEKMASLASDLSDETSWAAAARPGQAGSCASGSSLACSAQSMQTVYRSFRLNLALPHSMAATCNNSWAAHMHLRTLHSCNHSQA